MDNPCVGKLLPSVFPSHLSPLSSHNHNTHSGPSLVERGVVQWAGSVSGGSTEQDEERGERERGGERESEREGGRKVKGRMFPWLRLSVNDLYILKAAERCVCACVCVCVCVRV